MKQDMDKHVQIGASMWIQLSETFAQISASEANDFPEKLRLWSGFMGAAMGAMAADIGAGPTHAVIEVTLNQLDVIGQAHERRH